MLVTPSKVTYAQGVSDCLNLVSEVIERYESEAAKLLDMSSGKMSIHPVDRMKAKALRGKAADLKKLLTEMEYLTRGVSDAESLK